VPIFGRYLRCWRSLRPSCVLLIGGLMAWGCLGMALASHCQAQRGLLQGSTRGVFLPSDRRDSRGVERARKLIAAGEFSQAIRFLDEVLARAEDAFVGGASEDRTQEELTGLKEAARQMLRDLPSEGRRIYETTFGPIARRLLKHAAASGNPEQLRQIVQRYFHTPAGYQAALLFAQHEADEGRHLTAALTYQQLLETPPAAERFQPQLSLLAAISWLATENSQQATAVLEALSQQGHRGVQVAGEGYPLPAEQTDRIDWLQQTVGAPAVQDALAESQWLTARGNPARNGQTQGGLPHLRVRWQARLLEHQGLETLHEETVGVMTRQGKPSLPAATPLAAGNYIITRSAHGLLAIDFHSGKRIWQAQPQRESFLRSLLDANRQQNNNAATADPSQTLMRTLWQDYLYNTTSSDGQRVYAIRDLASPKLNAAQPFALMGRRIQPRTDSDTNRLCAYDLPTEGKLVWEIDGNVRNDQLRGAFFLGAPVTVGQSLYCLVEIKSETAIYLLALHRETGKLLWRQQLADLETGIAFDPQRRLQALMPSYDAGILVCPTGAGVVVGVDLAQQALAWAFQYQGENQTPQQRRLAAQSGLQPAHWVHSTPVIAGELVLLTPPESNTLYCLDLVTGKLRWQQPRDKAFFLAGVAEETVLLVGRLEVKALRLADGKPAWAPQKLSLAAGSVPVGTGFFSGGQYFLPLSGAQVVAIDVRHGKIVASTSSREGGQLGNLICHAGAVISQSGRSLDCFEQIDVLRDKSLRQHAADPTDFEALRTLGEISYNQGDLSEAIKLLSQAYESEPSDLRTQAVLAEALVSALDEDFATYQHHLAQLASIQQGSTTAQLTLLRLQSQGLLKLGQVPAAFQVCLEAYVKLAAEGDLQLAIGQAYNVSSRRWLAAQAASVWAAGSSAQREQMSRQFDELSAEVEQTESFDAWQDFYECFGTLPLAEPVGMKLAAHYVEQGDLLAGQQLLLRFLRSSTPEIRRAAIASVSRLLHQAGQHHQAQSFDAQLAGELAEEECLPGLSGKACLEQWAAESVARERGWPYGKVEVTQQKTAVARSAQRSRSPRSGIRLERSDAVLGHCHVSLLDMVSGRNRELVIQNSLGQNFYRAKIGQTAQAYRSSAGSVYGVSRGNLLVLSLGRQIMALDTLSTSRKVLWRKKTTSGLLNSNQRQLTLRSGFGEKRVSALPEPRKVDWRDWSCHC